MDTLSKFPHSTTQPDVYVTNPFIGLESTDPSTWGINVFRDAVISFVEVEQSTIPDEPSQRPSPFVKSVHNQIQQLHKYPDDTRFRIGYIQDLICKLGKWLVDVKEVSLEYRGCDHGDTINIAGHEWRVNTVSGWRIGELPIFRYTNTAHRKIWRDSQRDPGRYFDKLAELAMQDDEALDPLDLAELVSLAQQQRELGLYVDEYTVYLMYPNHALDQLFVLTATIPSQTLDAIEKGEKEMKPIHIQHGKVALVLHTTDEQPWQQSALAKVLAVFVDHAVEIAGMVVDEPEEEP
ncbi:hypothetical protein Hypma_004389 [Hypsizygus marmoreus]|uniref:Uncharacterized protein n=1 Tax=Hypsizygus marmoreus TaxID=39966 RepID=A0A369K8E7_HYPMA|nr:hypothetical protein Hypma_004389 [Hypsizygus marmoreus]